jgi:phosphopantetheinyl transferase (holo-ACP synthase)
MTFLKEDNEIDFLKTIGYLKKIIDHKKWLSKNNPQKFMEKYMTQEERETWKKRMTELRNEYYRTKGMSKDKTMKHIFDIPEKVYYANIEYWDEIITSRDYARHPYFMVAKYYTNVKD